MMKTLLKVGMLASLVTAISAPAIMPNVVFAQADVRLKDRRKDRQQNRLEDRQADRDGRGRYGLTSHTNQTRQDFHPDAVFDS